MNLSYFSPKTAKRGSAIEGRGLFAITPITKGEVTVVKECSIMTLAKRDEVEKELGPAEIQVTEELFIWPTSQAEREGGYSGNMTATSRGSSKEESILRNGRTRS